MKFKINDTVINYKVESDKESPQCPFPWLYELAFQADKNKWIFVLKDVYYFDEIRDKGKRHPPPNFYNKVPKTEMYKLDTTKCISL